MKYCIAAGIIALGQAASAATFTWTQSINLTYQPPALSLCEPDCSPSNPSQHLYSYLADFSIKPGLLFNDTATVTLSATLNTPTFGPIEVMKIQALFVENKGNGPNGFFADSVLLTEQNATISTTTEISGESLQALVGNPRLTIQGDTILLNTNNDVRPVNLANVDVVIQVEGAELAPVPLPASGWGLLTGLGLLSIKRLRTSHYPA